MCNDDTNTDIGLLYSKEFFEQYQKVMNESAKPEKYKSYNEDKNFVTTERIFTIPYVNRKQKVKFEFLLGCTKELEQVHLTPKIGNLKIQTSKFHDQYKKVRSERILYISIFYYLLLSLLISLTEETTSGIVLLMIGNIFLSYILAYGSYYSINFLKNFFVK